MPWNSSTWFLKDAMIMKSSLLLSYPHPQCIFMHILPHTVVPCRLSARASLLQIRSICRQHGGTPTILYNKQTKNKRKYKTQAHNINDRIRTNKQTPLTAARACVHPFCTLLVISRYGKQTSKMTSANSAQSLMTILAYFWRYSGYRFARNQAVQTLSLTVFSRLRNGSSFILSP